jgi:hypothetical protein
VDFEAALRARLTGASGVTSVVGQRIYWVERPQATALPAITLQIIDDPREQTMGGFQSRLFCTVQADVWALTYAAAKAGKEAVIAALAPKVTANGIKFGDATNIAARDLSERTETQFIYRASIDFRFNYAPDTA